MSGRKIRMTAVGLIAMPADRDEATVTVDDVMRSPELCTALGFFDRSNGWGWCAAIEMAHVADLDGLRASLARSRRAATAAGLPTDHEDAALAMLPEDAS